MSKKPSHQTGALLPKCSVKLLIFPILQHYHIWERFQRATKCGKFSHATLEFDVMLKSTK